MNVSLYIPSAVRGSSSLDRRYNVTSMLLVGLFLRPYPVLAIIINAHVVEIVAMSWTSISQVRENIQNAKFS